MKTYHLLKSLFLTKLSICLFIAANAQKLPDVQQQGVLLPAGAKVDGKALEWNNQFQAYNKGTRVYYTMANDGDKLYLSIQARDPVMISKIVTQGITLTINPDNRKELKNAISFTFPFYNKTFRRPSLSANSWPKKTRDTVVYQLLVDTFVNVKNTTLGDFFKVIDIRGAKNMDNGETSVYNDLGIKARMLFDNKANYNYELAIPLQYLGLTAKDKADFAYNLSVNGYNNGDIKVIERGNLPSILTFTGADGVDYMIGPGTPENMILSYPVDFWAEYKLVNR